MRELHGVIQVAMGWEGIHLYQFCVRSRRYGSWEVSASSPDVTLASLKLRRGARFTYEYDLNIPWRHEVRIEENRLDTPPGKAYPTCIAGDGARPPEDCGGPHGYLAGLDNASSWDALEDLHTMADILREVVFDVDPPACVEPFMLLQEVCSMPITRPAYSPEFRRQIIDLVRAGREPADLAREFEPSAESIRKWVARADKQEGRREEKGGTSVSAADVLTTTERDELARLRRENRQLRVERDILSRAAAWFARETGAVPSGSSGS